MNSKIKDEMVDTFLNGVLELRNLEESYAFFEDVCTIAEIKSMASRFKVAQMLDAGKTYTEIYEATGVSTATISRVNRALEYGTDGYRKIIHRLKEKQG